MFQINIASHSSARIFCMVKKNSLPKMRTSHEMWFSWKWKIHKIKVSSNKKAQKSVLNSIIKNNLVKWATHANEHAQTSLTNYNIQRTTFIIFSNRRASNSTRSTFKRSTKHDFNLNSKYLTIIHFYFFNNKIKL